MIRCAWVTNDPLYITYHDTEWGVPVREDKKLFEFLILESAQAGLSWLTVLKRREGYRHAFADFNPEIVAGFSEEQVTKLVQDPTIIRHRKKIEAAINNARVFLTIQNEFGSFSTYLWSFVDNKPLVHAYRTLADIPVRTELSDTISKDLKQRGMSFVGSTIVYAHLQATGLVHDHTTNCFRYKQFS